ncbi:RnfH family protein [Pistricoccus aurantiacus]|uniref:UPF0125 protein FGL86_05250 n=1 Tax=Pistricoccus aurantiacus TaxID=1883414 RepID=A0A5B8SN34_9GAMM|nr:RnfH family protein [Pistricoccus aurantiacus]QEA38542.1 RnfH family protein [Pistricoccus aurantiacus]
MEDKEPIPFFSKVTIEVAFALPSHQKIVILNVEAGTTARQAVALAELEQYFPELPIDTFTQADLGIFGKPLRDPATYEVREGDRVEVYRPLIIDPVSARARRAKTARSPRRADS